MAASAKIDLRCAPSSMEQRAASWVSPEPAAEEMAAAAARRALGAGGDRKQFNIYMSVELYEALAALAGTMGISPTEHARRILADSVAAPLARKPLIRAEMVATAQRADVPLDSFVRLLLERGFQSFCADARIGEAA